MNQSRKFGCPRRGNGVNKRFIAMLGLLMLLPLTSMAQRILTLDSCRAMALRNNKQMGVAKMKQEVNANLRKSGRLSMDEQGNFYPQ